MNRKRRLFFVFAGMAMSVWTARADIYITLDNPAQTGVPGSTLQFFGSVGNTGPDAVFLNGDSLNLAGGGDFTTNDLFFTNVPISVASGGSSGDIELFDVTVSDPFVNAFTTYNGNYTLLGGVDGNAQDVLGQADFSVAVTPEPRMWAPVLLLGGLSAIAAWRSRKRSQITAN